MGGARVIYMGKDRATNVGPKRRGGGVLRGHARQVPPERGWSVGRKRG